MAGGTRAAPARRRPAPTQRGRRPGELATRSPDGDKADAAWRGAGDADAVQCIGGAAQRGQRSRLAQAGAVYAV
ncbi:hypothetical protein GCM10029978_086200 [Actinoallomurus acanthiterrae]